MQDSHSFISLKARRALLAVMVLLAMSSLACSLTGLFGSGEEGGGDAVETFVARTLHAEETEGARQDTVTPSPEVTATNTPAPSDTPTLIPTDTNTPTPSSVGVHVTGNTNCRVGPADNYQGLGIFNTDQESEIIAKDPSGSYWYIVNPDNPDQKCWIWGNYATPEGPTAGLPVFTPPPSPTPGLNFSVAVTGFSGCVGPWFEIEVVNNGGIPLESYSVTAKETNSGNTYGPNTGNIFEYWRGCLDGPKKDTISPGGSHKIMSEEITGPTLDYNPRGKPFRITIKICSKENLSGQCLTRYLSHTP